MRPGDDRQTGDAANAASPVDATSTIATSTIDTSQPPHSRA